MARMSWGGRGAKQRSWRKWNKNNHDKQAPGASIDMKPLSWRKSWSLSISKSGSAGRASRRLGTIGPADGRGRSLRPSPALELGGKASCSRVWLRPPPSGPRVGRHRLCRGTGGTERHRRPQPCAPANRRHALRSAWQGCDRGGPPPEPAGCDVPSHDGGRGTLPGPQISGPAAQRRAHFACPLRAPAARRVKSPKTQARS